MAVHLVELPHLSDALAPGVEGLRERMTLDRGLGVLLNRGHDLDGARAELQHRAQESSTDLTTAARALLHP